ncbi:hypothetical protein [Limimaricola sp.]|uniref:hypothetical protein n=1 Tax=Limimaricola sp. TaxID=2211665 RepID=UPI0040582CC7
MFSPTTAILLALLLQTESATSRRIDLPLVTAVTNDAPCGLDRAGSGGNAVRIAPAALDEDKAELPSGAIEDTHPSVAPRRQGAAMAVRDSGVCLRGAPPDEGARHRPPEACARSIRQLQVPR